MSKHKIHISCPKCGWKPDGGIYWMCSVCKTKWNTFETRGRCPGCGQVYEETRCPRNRGCGQVSNHADWYREIEMPKTGSVASLFSLHKNDEPPVTINDKMWIEQSLLFLAELFEPVFFNSLTTITPDKEYFDRDFDGTEDDAEFILKKVSSIMSIKPWEIKLMYFSEQPGDFSEGIANTPSEKLKGSWTSRESELVNKAFGDKEIWIDLAQIGDPIGLIVTISNELSKYKLISEYAIGDDVNNLAHLTAIVFGFGIFKGNDHFKFTQWQGNTHHGWRMQKRGGPPEPVIAYSMAWLAHYRKEDISWKLYLNKTMQKYFERSYNYIEKNKDKIKWE
ncbi:MAG TPA: hypothetical protein VHC47_10970 [Mucilaginibacter sp.]|nr:hypothetical protein [Mucilaginibacter sp.]